MDSALLLAGLGLSNTTTILNNDPNAITNNNNATIVLLQPVDRVSCSLLGQTGLVVQGIMALLVLSTLVIKRYRENPPRTWPVWMADVSKQVIGQGFLHASNILISTLVSHHEKRDACSAYFLSILVDCTLGILIIFAMLRIFAWILITNLHLPGFRTGQYYPPKDALVNDISSSSSTTKFQMGWWARQLVVYLISLTVMKLAILGFFWIPVVFEIGDWVLSWFGEDSKIVFVLMVFPLLMNLFQFLIIDAILKSSQHKADEGSFHKDEESAAEHDGRGNSQRRSTGDEDDDEDNNDENQAFLARTSIDDPVELDRQQNKETFSTSRRQPPTYRDSQTGGADTHQDYQAKGPGSRSPKYPPAQISRTFSEKDRIAEVDILPVSVAPSALPSTRYKTTPPLLQSEKSPMNDDSGWDWLDEDEQDDRLQSCRGVEV